MLDKEARMEWLVNRVAQEFKTGDVVNLGIGIPTKVANALPEGIRLILQSENGYLGVGPAPETGKEDPDTVNAGGQYATILPGGCCFDSAMSFAIIRGGHVDATVLGALQVDEEGNLANWMIPGKIVPGIGGAMDLVVGARRVIVAMEHTAKNGGLKVLKKCTLPLTASKQVNLIITDMGVMEVTSKGLILRELAPGVSFEEVQACTEASLIRQE
ncbi:3-oxoacid CoA-transferase subunit B [Desulfosporosinus nitroreducens]|uniref:3-oxoacid CoA-transferase subunit B n=1 Tax=Desulfosporosinus nitroreducens TaxID=2018668 RepID=A0ABT8QPT2_9FIRM|nr:3-oxoacid CoA-transferase subunit B [Desulfosporosinus nitroreducens]MDO0822584.1 3-oxoacid CoA-transferase subunit B [Desulfosporosinus nitroreducens]